MNQLPSLATNGGNLSQQQIAAQQQASHSPVAATTYRSKYAGQPGSASALHLHYGFRNNAPAFDPLPSDHASAVARRDARRWAQGTRLGQKPEWDTTTTTTDSGGHPRRALMHQLSEFQAPKLVFNFRAQQVPSVHKAAVPVWKAGKFKVDQTSFLGKSDRDKSTHHVQGTTNALSHAEMPITEDKNLQKRESGWKQSVELDKDRANLFTNKQYADFRSLNKTKAILDHDRYVPPTDDVRRRIDKARDEKRVHREQQQEFVARMKREARARRGLKPMSLAAEAGQDSQVFKMSNIDQWWQQSPPEVVEASMVLQQKRLEEEERVKKALLDEEQRMANQPTTLRVVAPGQQQQSGGPNSVPTSGR